ncbi:RidA family protein [Bailinhaonella thermotolerans]|uniref:RidA family protein n=1 Tax=Bailinhaonella thermotolerans TaxID=1070861 RepID=A0A3A4B3R6_9ACTN|nr:RidA family protein [Bailinhaonella thermotolerans]RJL32020.1 RidA family protein [Bailinhaonella thermotolerans]
MSESLTVERVVVEPDWYEPYRISQAMKAGGLVFVSGQAGIDHQGRTVPGGFLEQGRQAIRNLEFVLNAAGSSLKDLVKVNIMVRNMAENLENVLTLRGEFFSEPYPADNLLEVASLAQPDWLIEIDAVAVAR